MDNIKSVFDILVLKYTNNLIIEIYIYYKNWIRLFGGREHLSKNLKIGNLRAKYIKIHNIYKYLNKNLYIK